MSLFLVPNLLGVVPPQNVLPARTIAIARDITHWIVETPKPARAFIKSLSPAHAIADLDIRALDSGDASTLLAPAREGDAGLLSDAGCPGVADPGADVVAAAHAIGIRVVPLVGPSSILLALMASGMNGQSFAFHGYLPVPAADRAQALRRLEDDSRANGRTHLFIETPYRNAAMIGAIAEALRPSTSVCVAADLTLPTETIERRTAAAWKRADASRFAKRPAMFVLSAGPWASPRCRT